MIRLGIVQGRLTPPIKGFQCCPDDWMREFVLLGELGLTHIEWIVTNNDLDSNPIFWIDKQDNVSSICLDNLVDSSCQTPEFLLRNLDNVVAKLSKKGYTNFTIPLLEDATLNDEARYLFVSEHMRQLCNNYKHINFLLETDCSIKRLSALCDISENILVTYDTGNITSCKISHASFIQEFATKIRNVHLKDKVGHKSVEPLTGQTDFITIFKHLKKIGYSGPYTLQTARGIFGEEVRTTTQHANLFRTLYDSIT